MDAFTKAKVWRAMKANPDLHVKTVILAIRFMQERSERKLRAPKINESEE